MMPKIAIFKKAAVDHFQLTENDTNIIILLSIFCKARLPDQSGWNVNM